MPSLIITMTPTASDHRRAVRLTSRRTRCLTGTAGGAMILAGLPLLTSDHLAPLIGLGLGIAGIGLILRSSLLPSQIVGRLPAAAFAPRECEIGPDGVRLSTDETTRTWSWKAIHGAARTRDFWVLRGSQRMTLALLPRRAFSPEQERQFGQLLGECATHAKGIPDTAPRRPA